MRPLLIILFSLCYFNCFAQSVRPGDTMYSGAKCNMSTSTAMVGDISAAAHIALPSPGSFIPKSIISCGRFSLYFEDINSSTKVGYDDPSLGVLRINNLCGVLSYIEGLFDISKVPYGGIRLLIRSSAAGSSEGFYNYSIPSGTFPTVDGFVVDYIKSGTDPAPSDFLGVLRIRFSAYFAGVTSLNSDISREPEACEIDLASLHLHYLGHILGFNSFIGITGGSFTSPGYLTSIDKSVHTSPNPVTSYFPMASLLPLFNASTGTFSPATLGTELFWINGNQPPNNHGLIMEQIPSKVTAFDYSRHMADLRCFKSHNRISPGEYGYYAMGEAFGDGGVMRREFSKGEIETFTNIVGLPYNTAYLTSHPNVGNNRPFSKKMSSDSYNHLLDRDGGADVLTPDYVLTNDVGSNVSIDLSLDPDLVDSDGDPISIYPGSIVNFRGCGDVAGNNHNSLVVDPSNTIITYIPRSNFYGIAQFGFNLYDGKEKGAFVWYTIKVERGTNVHISPGDNMVLNGSFEYGEEVRTVGSIPKESVNNSLVSQGDLYGKRFDDRASPHFADAQPFTSMRDGFFETIAINQSSGGIGCVYTKKDPFGAWHTTFPKTVPSPYIFPSPHIPTEARYAGVSEAPILFNLGEDMQHCKHYELSLYGFRNLPPSMSPGSYGVKDEIRFGFTDDNHLTFSNWTTWTSLSSVGLIANPTASSPALITFSDLDWKKAKIRFTYCATDPSNVLYLLVKSGFGVLMPPKFLIDEISLTEVPFNVTADIAYTEEGCKRRLVADKDLVAAYGCNPTFYVWRKSSGAIVATTKEFVVDALEPETYTVTADDGCGHTATASVVVDPCRCSPYIVFSAQPYTTLTSASVIPSPLPAGNYYVTSDIAINTNNSFTSSVFLMEPDVKWTVGPSAMLSISNAHLLTCPDTAKLWKGIELASGGSVSGRIVIQDNSLIEDAVTAIKTVGASLPSSGKIIDISNTVFNRNTEGIRIESFNPGGAPSILPFEFKSSVFTSRQMRSFPGYPLLWPSQASLAARYSNTAPTAPIVLCRDYMPITCKQLTPAYYGIKLNSVGGSTSSAVLSEVVIGKAGSDTYRNVFDNLGDGIISAFSNVTCYNNDFANMSFSPGAPPTVVGTNGSGVSGVSNKGFFYNQTRVLGVNATTGTNDPTKNSFYDCNIGVRISNMWKTDISLNYFQTSNVTPYYVTPFGRGFGLPVGVDILGSNYALRQINENLFYNVPTGMQLRSNSNYGFYFGQTNIDKNKFYAQPPSPVATNSLFYSYLGIILDNTPWYTTTGTVIGSNDISNNGVFNTYNGLIIRGINRQATNLTGNNVTLRLKPGEPQYGIGLMGNPTVGDADLTATSNEITGLSGTSGTELPRAIYAAFCNRLKLCGNHTHNTGRGFEFSQLTPQPGTRWISNTMENHKKGMVLGSDIGHQGFTWDPTTGASYFGAIMNVWNGSTWVGGNYHTYADAGIKSVNSKLYVQNITTPGAVQKPGNNFGFPAANAYTIGTSINLTSSLTNCDGRYRLKPKPLFYMILSDSLGYSSSYRRNQWMAQLGIYNEALQDSELRDSVAVVARLLDSAANSRYAWILHVEKALSDSNVVLADSLLNALPAASGYHPVDSELVITDYSEADSILSYYQRFYSIYLKSLTHSLSANDTLDLQVLTTRCPGTDGAVVYMARSLYEQWIGQSRIYADDYCNNISGGPIVRTTPKTEDDANPHQTYTLVPNPNNGNFTLHQRQTDEMPVVVCIYNSVGMLLQKREVVFSKGSVTFSLQQPIPGLHLICINGRDGSNTCLRFTIH